MYILKDLWYGNLAPNGRSFSPDGPYKKLLTRLLEQEEQISRELSESGQKLFDEYDKTQGDLLALSEEEVFIIGFRMGAQTMLDVLQNT